MHRPIDATQQRTALTSGTEAAPFQGVEKMIYRVGTGGGDRGGVFVGCCIFVRAHKMDMAVSQG